MSTSQEIISHQNGSTQDSDKPHRVKKSRKWDVREPEESNKKARLDIEPEKQSLPSPPPKPDLSALVGKALPSPEDLQKKINALLSQIPKKTDIKPPSSLSHSKPTTPSTPPANVTPPSSTSSYSDERSKMEEEVREKAKRLAEIQAKVNETLKSLPKLKTKEEEKTTYLPPPLLLDSEGREIDALGNVVNVKLNNVQTLEFNKRLRQTHDTVVGVKPKKSTESNESEQISSTPFYDHRLSIPRSTRAKRNFSFVTPGTYIKKAEKARSKLRSLNEENEEISSDPVVSLQDDLPKKKKREIIPETEWWDNVFLSENRYPGQFDDSEEKFAKVVNLDKVTHYIEFPILPKPVGEAPPPAALPVMLTKAERKKLRKRNRMEKQRELEEKRLLGLIEAPKPKLRPSNMVRVLGSQAIQDPTMAEKEAKAAVNQRISEHESRNQARKLTVEEKRAKKMKKMEEDTSSGLTVCLFKVTDLSHPQKRYKVDINAQQNHLTGCVLLYKEFSVVVVEGGTKASNRFKKLMLRRIDWNSQIPGTEDLEEGSSVPINKCQLVWEGLAAKSNFKNFKFEECKTEAQAVKYLRDRGCEHYWNFCKHFDPNLSTPLPSTTTSTRTSET